MHRILRKVDIHSHVMPMEIYGSGGAYGPEIIRDPATGYSMYRAGRWQSAPGTFQLKDQPTLFDPSVRLAEMDALEIDVMGVTISPMFYLYGAPLQDAINYTSLHNDLMAAFCAAAPDRLFFIPTLPLQNIDAALRELERAAGLGGRGINMGTDNIAGRDLDHQDLYPIYELAQRLEMPIFLHPAPIGTDDPAYEPAKNVKDKFGFSWLLGYNYREMVAFATLVLSGVLDRFPNLKFCIPHGGGFVPFQLGRVVWAATTPRLGISKCKRPVAEYLANFYFDTVVHDVRARRFLLEICGPDHIVVGSNYAGWDWVDGFEYAREMVDNEVDLAKIWAGNAVALFKLTGMGRPSA
ncbi:MAG TPA: amidohydrolase family protein [Candidatus Binataceae bacterium]|nr:amidohydrolase family protein [Candidatus Binataceae bacterium]